MGIWIDTGVDEVVWVLEDQWGVVYAGLDGWLAVDRVTRRGKGKDEDGGLHMSSYLVLGVGVGAGV